MTITNYKQIEHLRSIASNARSLADQLAMHPHAAPAAGQLDDAALAKIRAQLAIDIDAVRPELEGEA